MDDTVLTVLAGSFEFGLLLALIFIGTRFRARRSLVTPAIGAATPFALFMLYGLVEHLFLSPPESNMYMAGFVVGFVPYILCIVFGLLLGLVLPENVGNLGRYFIGFIFAPGAVAILVSSL